MSDTAPVIDDLDRAQDAAQNLVDGIRDEQWQLATPCDEWSVRQLVNHVVGPEAMFHSEQPAPFAAGCLAAYVGRRP